VKKKMRNGNLPREEKTGLKPKVLKRIKVFRKQNQLKPFERKRGEKIKKTSSNTGGESTKDKWDRGEGTVNRGGRGTTHGGGR